MKKIYVTVAEFRRGGGSLSKGRELYYHDGDEAGIYQSVKDYDTLNVKDFGIDFIMTEHQAYVQIDCTPIYK